MNNLFWFDALYFGKHQRLTMFLWLLSLPMADPLSETPKLNSKLSHMVRSSWTTVTMTLMLFLHVHIFASLFKSVWPKATSALIRVSSTALHVPLKTLFSMTISPQMMTTSLPPFKLSSLSTEAQSVFGHKMSRSSLWFPLQEDATTLTLSVKGHSTTEA